MSLDILCLATGGRGVRENITQPSLTFNKARTVLVCKRFLALVLIELTEEDTLITSHLHGTNRANFA